MRASERRHVIPANAGIGYRRILASARMTSTKLKMTRSQAGYTLIELIVAMTIFAVVLIVAIGSFISVHQSSNKTTAQRSIQQDARYNLEEIARQARTSEINYAFYAFPPNSSDARCGLAGRKLLALIYPDEGGAPRQVFFWHEAGTVNAISKYDFPGSASEQVRCSDVLNPSRDRDFKYRLTADGVRVPTASFVILPSENPLDALSTPENRSIHPRVTIVFTVETGPLVGGGVTRQSERSSIVLQTTVSSRAYKLAPDDS